MYVQQHNLFLQSYLCPIFCLYFYVHITYFSNGGTDWIIHQANKKADERKTKVIKGWFTTKISKKNNYAVLTASFNHIKLLLSVYNTCINIKQYVSVWLTCFHRPNASTADINCSLKQKLQILYHKFLNKI